MRTVRPAKKGRLSDADEHTTATPEVKRPATNAHAYGTESARQEGAVGALEEDADEAQADERPDAVEDEGMNFAQALEMVRDGLYVRREGWQKKDVLLGLSVNRLDLSWTTDRGKPKTRPWNPRQADLLADDLKRVRFPASMGKCIRAGIKLADGLCRI